MKHIPTILLMVFALSTLSVAQSQSNAQKTAASGIVSGPTVETTGHSAAIHWKTDDHAGTIVWYGTEKNNLKREAREGGAGGSFEHTVTLSDLKPGTKYYYRILKGTGEPRAEGEFTTQGAAQAGSSNPQHNAGSGIVSGPTVETTDHSATIHWKTEDRAGSIVAYGTDKNTLKKEEHGRAGGSLEHNVTLSDLKPGTKYFYQILEGDDDIRTEGEFTTQGTAQVGSSGGEKPGSEQDNVVITQGPVFQPGANGTGKIVWKTDDIAANDVKYGTDPINLQERAFKHGGSHDHEADLKNLQAGQTYYFQILRRNGSVRTTGQFQYQPQAAATATTPGPAAPPAQESALQFTLGPTFKTVGDRSASLGWQTNNVSNTIVHYSTDPKNLNLIATGPWGTDHAVEIRNLNPNTRYYFQVESSPSAGNAVRSGVAGFQTVAPGAQAKQNPPLIH